ncbi:conserved hypothetical protein [Streptomyces lividans TK24]|uniref:Uncharacterized protein n=1 Tax=Streptomyces lividans TaxID=1916 RepID=A7TUX9_STRLI|nr:hypothetical protein SLG82 [Streptomyces lividans]EFD65996.1 conserved hypothetical protein [Streptomyces lividans TK24]
MAAASVTPSYLGVLGPVGASVGPVCGDLIEAIGLPPQLGRDVRDPLRVQVLHDAVLDDRNGRPHLTTRPPLRPSAPPPLRPSAPPPLRPSARMTTNSRRSIRRHHRGAELAPWGWRHRAGHRHPTSTRDGSSPP